MKKQMQYANARQIPYVALAGESEIAAGIFTLKNMQTGEQKALTTEQLIDAING
jgi:histidyl-tRNA synthetase